jgi:DNA-binding ferritin-like protein (Dps family)
MRNILEGEILRQLMLINFDRSETLLVQENNFLNKNNYKDVELLNEVGLSDEGTPYVEKSNKEKDKPVIPKNYKSGNPYEVLKKYPTSKNIAKVLTAADNWNDKEAWAEMAFNLIKDKTQYKEVSSILGDDAYSFVKDYMGDDVNKKWHNKMSIKQKYKLLKNVSYLDEVRVNPTASEIVNILTKSNKSFFGDDNEENAEKAFNAIKDAKMYQDVGDLLNYDPYEYCKRFMSTDKKHNTKNPKIKTIKDKFKSLKTTLWHFNLKSDDPIKIGKVLKIADEGLWAPDVGFITDDKEYWVLKAFLAIKDWETYQYVSQIIGEDVYSYVEEMLTAIVPTTYNQINGYSYLKKAGAHYSNIYVYNRLGNLYPRDKAEIIATSTKNATLGTFGVGFGDKEAWAESVFNTIKTNKELESVRQNLSVILNKDINNVYDFLKGYLNPNKVYYKSPISKQYKKLLNEVPDNLGENLSMKDVNLKSALDKVNDLMGSMKSYLSGYDVNFSNCTNANQVYSLYSLYAIKALTNVLFNTTYIGRTECLQISTMKLNKNTNKLLYAFTTDPSAYTELLTLMTNSSVNDPDIRTLGNTFPLKDFYYNFNNIIQDYNNTIKKNPNSIGSLLFPDGWYQFYEFYFGSLNFNENLNDIKRGLSDKLSCSNTDGKFLIFSRKTKITSYSYNPKSEIYSILHVALPTLSIIGGLTMGPLGGYISQMAFEGLDAALYYSEGKKYEAGLAAIFAIMPFDYIFKIPGARELGKRGIEKLLVKIFEDASTRGAKTTLGRKYGKKLLEMSLTASERRFLYQFTSKGFKGKFALELFKKVVKQKLTTIKNINVLVRLIISLVKKGYLASDFMVRFGAPVYGGMKTWEQIAKMLGIKEGGEDKKVKPMPTPKQFTSNDDWCIFIKDTFTDFIKRKITIKSANVSYYIPITFTQLLLKKMGYLNDIDKKFKWGDLDTNTVSAIKRFQLKEKITSDGILNDKTFATLINKINSKVACPVIPPKNIQDILIKKINSIPTTPPPAPPKEIENESNLDIDLDRAKRAFEEQYVPDLQEKIKDSTSINQFINDTTTIYDIDIKFD